MIGQAELQGHWQRDWIRTPGVEDHTTRVHWLQAGALFADLRIPLDRPEIAGLSCLADLAPPDLAWLLTAEGFAGHISVAQSQCTWHRSINWHGIPGLPDVGLMSFDPDGALIEDGVHADYRELWRRVPQAPLRGHAIESGGATGVLIESDDVFLLGIGPRPDGSTEGLRTALTAGSAPLDGLRALFDGEYVLGQWDGSQGITRLSTNPFQEGQVALERGRTFTWHAQAFEGHKTAHPLKPA